MTEDEEYERELREKAAKRVKFQILIEDMIIHRVDLIDYLEWNQRALQVSNYDLEVFKQLIERVANVADLPQSRYFKVMS